MLYIVGLSDGHSLERRIGHLHKRTIVDVTTNPSENNEDGCWPAPTMGNDLNNVVPDAPPP